MRPDLCQGPIWPKRSGVPGFKIKKFKLSENITSWLLVQNPFKEHI